MSKLNETDAKSKKPIMIYGSSSSFGKTRDVLEEFCNDSIPLIDLNSLDITPFDYEHKNKDDDFMPLIEKVIKQHDPIILATPVYWYTMSATMKIFIDRISDLWDLKKELLDELRGKSLFVIASYGGSYPKGFEYPFKQTCDYLGINYLGCSFIYTGNDSELIKSNVDEQLKISEVLGLIEQK